MSPLHKERPPSPQGRCAPSLPRCLFLEAPAHCPLTLPCPPCPRAAGALRAGLCVSIWAPSARNWALTLRAHGKALNSASLPTPILGEAAGKSVGGQPPGAGSQEVGRGRRKQASSPSSGSGPVTQVSSTKSSLSGHPSPLWNKKAQPLGERVGLLDALKRPAPALPPTLVEARRGHPSLPWDVGPARGPQARCPWAGLLPSATPASLAASDQQAGFGADRAS